MKNAYLAGIGPQISVGFIMFIVLKYEQDYNLFIMEGYSDHALGGIHNTLHFLGMAYDSVWYKMQ